MTVGAPETYRLRRRATGVFAYTAFDIIPVLAGVLHLVFVVLVIAGFGSRAWWLNLAFGVIYAISISWNINGISHNFIHTPYFTRRWMNYAFSVVESLAIGFSQCLYRWVHLRHHVGNSDRPDKSGNTIDTLSIYRHGRNGEPENVWRFVLLSFFRDDPFEAYRALKRKHPFDATFGAIEVALFATFVLGALIYDWRAVLFLVPFHYAGNALSSLNGYYEHYGSNPDKPLAWGVSSYALLYNILWFNNGHHAEHHFRPSVHWTRLPALHKAIGPAQQEAGTHVIRTSHAMGFLDPSNRTPGTHA
jgi:fatty acid desaturase